MILYNLFNTLIIRPVFNILVAVYALLPGHDFGLAIIIFTILIRLLMWPLIKKQLHHTKKLRELQPELKKIKAAAKGDRQKESKLTMELYKEKKVSPFATLGLTLLQFPILIGLYIGLERVIKDPHNLTKVSYSFIDHLPWMKVVGADIGRFHNTLFGSIDLNRLALGHHGWYIPALILVLGSAIMQYFTSKQLLPVASEKKSLRQILKEAGSGTKTDQADMQAATGRFTSLMIPFLIFFITVRLAAALSLYWFVSSLVAYIQQAKVLNSDEEALEAVGNKSTAKIIEGEIVKKKKPSPKAASKAKKRRK